ncbi:MAG: preprotein translocase subunit SecG [Arsenophonus endosymbiont of Ceratovacuna japonica]
MYVTLLFIFLLVSIALICMIILQQSKGIDIGSSFSISASETLFGSLGSSNFITRLTAIFAILFFVISLILGNLTSKKNVINNKWENITKPMLIQDTKLAGDFVHPIVLTKDIPN